MTEPTDPVAPARLKCMEKSTDPTENARLEWLRAATAPIVPAALIGPDGLVYLETADLRPLAASVTALFKHLTTYMEDLGSLGELAARVGRLRSLIVPSIWAVERELRDIGFDPLARDPSYISPDQFSGEAISSLLDWLFLYRESFPEYQPSPPRDKYLEWSIERDRLSRTKPRTTKQREPPRFSLQLMTLLGRVVEDLRASIPDEDDAESVREYEMARYPHPSNPGAHRPPQPSPAEAGNATDGTSIPENNNTSEPMPSAEMDNEKNKALKKQRKQKAPRRKTIEERMKEKIRKDDAVKLWSVTQWTICLGCSRAGVQSTSTWKIDCLHAKEVQKAARKMRQADQSQS